MRTKNQKYLYSQDLEPVSKEIAFHNSFRHYRKFYFYTLEQVLPSNFPGCQQLSECTFQNPIEQEARGPLAQILDLQRPITYVEPGAGLSVRIGKAIQGPPFIFAFGPEILSLTVSPKEESLYRAAMTKQIKYNKIQIWYDNVL